MVASVKRKQAALAYAAAIAKGEDAHMEDDTTDAIGLAVLGSEDLLEVDDVPDAPEHLGVLAEKVSRALGATEASVLQGLVASRAHASELVASSPHGLDTVRLDATGGSMDEEEEEFRRSVHPVDRWQREEGYCVQRLVSSTLADSTSVGQARVASSREQILYQATTGWRGCWCRLAHLEVIACTTYFTSAQVFDLYQNMPSGDVWAEIRIKLLVILFSRVVDVSRISARDVTTCLYPDSLAAAPPAGHLDGVGSPHFFEEWRPAPVAEGRPARGEDYLSTGGRGLGARLFTSGQFRDAEDPLVLGGWAPPDEKEWAEMDPADMSETKLPTRGTLTFSATADPGPSGESLWTWWRAGASGRRAVFLV